jgi:hypothetical protein
VRPDFLSHYYEAAIGPFVALSDLLVGEAEQMMTHIRQISHNMNESDTVFAIIDSRAMYRLFSPGIGVS